MEPTRFARQAPPEKVAVQLRGAATAGSNQIRDFKKAFHSDDMRSLWQTVNSAEFPQGQDVWTTDYTALLSTIGSSASTESTNFKADEAISSIIGAFREANPDVGLSTPDAPEQLPIVLTVASMHFRVVQGQAAGTYKVEAQDLTNVDPTQSAILHYIDRAHKHEGLSNLLSLLASYKNVMNIACQKCQKVFDQSLRLPLARERNDSKDDAPRLNWKALHEDCRGT